MQSLRNLLIEGLSGRFEKILSELKGQFSEIGLNVTFFPLEEKFLNKMDAAKYPMCIATLVINHNAGIRMLNTFRSSSMDVFNNYPNDIELEEKFTSLESSIA